MPLKTEKITGELKNIVDGCHCPPLSMVVTSALAASETQQEFLKRLEHGLEKLGAEISVMQMEINSTGEN